MGRAVVPLLCLLAAACQGAEPYIAAGAGSAWWPDTSNGEALEAGGDAGWALSAAAGLRHDLPGPFAGRVEAELSHRLSEIHGLNGGGREARFVLTDAGRAALNQAA